MASRGSGYKTAIVNLARRHPSLTNAEIAQRVGCHPSTVARHLRAGRGRQPTGAAPQAHKQQPSLDAVAGGEPAPTLFAKVIHYGGKWAVALRGRSVGLVEPGTKAEAIAWAERHMRSHGGGEVTVTDKHGRVTRRSIVRAAPRPAPLKVTVRYAKRGASLVYESDVAEALRSGRATHYRSRPDAEAAAHSYLHARGGGEVEIQDSYGTPLRTEEVPPADWWLGESDETSEAS